MEKLIKVQFSTYDELKRSLRNYKKDGPERKTARYLSNKLGLIKEHWQSFKEIHNRIVVLDTPKDLDTALEKYFSEEYFAQVEDFILDFRTRIEDDLEVLRPSNTTLNVTTINEEKSAGHELKLPRINLPTFNGDYKSWKAFYDLYATLIHNNVSLSHVQKLHYLKSSLKGEAEQLLQHFTITNANYAPAWQLLQERYDNPRLLIKNQLKILLSQLYAVKDSAANLRKLMDTTNECVQALNNLGIKTKEWDIILTYIVSERLSPDTKKLWEQQVGAKREFPKFDELKTFLEAQFRALESLGNNLPPARSLTLRHNFQSIKVYSCVVCSASHPLWHCPEFLKLDHSGKRNIVIQKHLCSNCLAKGHNSSHCPSKTSCFKCKHRHHTLLHNEEVITLKTKATPITNTRGEKSDDNRLSHAYAAPSSSNVHVGNVSVGNEVLLATALVKLVGKNGHNTIVRALVDQGSQASFVKESVIQRLHLQGTAVNVSISGLGDVKTGVSHAQITAELQSLHRDCKIPANLFVLKNLNTILPPRTIKKTKAWTHLQGLTLADPGYNKSEKIDMIIGADVFGRMLLNGLKVGSNGTPIAQNTIFGWILSGEIEEEPKHTITIAAYHCTISLDEQLRKFWELEELPPVKYLTEEEKTCERHYENTMQRSDGGRYIVSLPFRTDLPPKFGRSRCIALSRLRKMESTFENNEQLRQEYTKCMEEYLELNHMELARSTELENIKVNQNNQICYETNYLPHHGVLKESTTTKLRVVFDASSKTVNGPSLNEVLMTGPTLQDDLMTLLLRWRKHQVVLTADIEKMYRQIWVNSNDAEYQRILWRKSTSEPVRDYRLKTITFGTASAPYLAIRTLQQLARDESERFPLASSVTLTDFYVDDLLTGANSIDTALEIQEQIIQLLNAGGFNLRKWASNKAELLVNIPDEDRELSGVRNFEFGEKVKTLGMHWYPRADIFKYNINIDFNDGSRVTKRQFLSDISKIFDPLGFLAPIIIKPKMMMQAIWLKGIGWDDEISSDILRIWQEFRNQLKTIQNIEIPRWIGTSTESIEIHGFCDGSLHAYAAVLYARSTDALGNINVTLLAAKAKVTPIKQVSLPRIELCGATLLARLYKAVTKAMKFTQVKFRAWTDSTIVLSWLKSHPNKYKTFVANRIAEVQGICNGEMWSHVPTQDNPADCATRGLSPTEAIKHQSWWNGPHWLGKSEESWPSLRDLKETINEVRTIKVNLNSTIETSFGINICRYSSIRKLIRVTAYVLRFIARCKPRTGQKVIKWLTCQELEEALHFVIKQVQVQEFEQELKNLSSDRKASTGRLTNLNPFIDNTGLLRVGGRLQHAQISWAEKHPIILPSQHHVTSLIIDDMHKITLHGGPQLVLGLLRRKYWILRARSAVRARIHKCIACFKQRAECCSQLMGSLPAPRTTICRPFSHVGVDYCGPMDIKTSKLRNSKKHKCYLAIFVCLAVKAVHIEVVSEMSTDAFLAALKRFTSRRGLCSDMYSDNGTNFVGAKSVLEKDLLKHVRSLREEIPSLVENQGINWHFIPPAAPHFGGIWESAVKSTKYHLRRTIGNSSLTFEELTTLTTQVESCLNSRPICPVTSDPSDLTALTPGHFLIGAPILSIPEPSYLDYKEHSLTRWQYLQQLMQSFWKRWQNEYLTQLQQRPKWNARMRNLQKDDLVLIKQEKLPPCNWLLGRVIETHAGADNLVRVVSIKTKDAIYKRPINKLCLLPIEPNLNLKPNSNIP